MEALLIYQKLEKDFIVPELSDDWAQHMGSVSVFLSENFKKRSMGLVCDFTKKINKVYTAVFPSSKVMKYILEKDIENAMLFVHHPAVWDIRKAPEIFQQMDKKLLQQFKEKKISIYNLHVPLDNYGDYSTSVTLAKALDIKPIKSFAPYFGSMCGIFGSTDLARIQDLRKKFQKAVGHKVSLYEYGGNEIKKGVVAVIAGGGNNVEMLEEIVKAKINTFVTGITVKNEHSRKAHEFAERNKINLLGGTHYSTEKFACIAMCDYFKKIGIDCEFIEDKPLLEDL